jgi:transcriptional regulator GlxA family with amidase domain
MHIAIPLFDDLTVLDAIGPYEVLTRVPGARVTFVGTEVRAYSSDNKMLSLNSAATLDDVRNPDIICVPGGVGVTNELDGPLRNWVAAAHETSTWTTSVCTGALLLGAAGVLTGLRATTHWLNLERLREFGATPTGDRVVEQGKVVTAAGVSSGIDMALMLAGRIAGDDVAQAIQLSIEYDPEPPYDAGAPEKAPDAIVEMVRAAVAEREKRSAGRAAS